jgi:hypothetical protein
VRVLQKPEVEQTTITTVTLVNQMLPLMMFAMLFQLMMSFTAMIRELVPKKEEVKS